MKNNKSLIAVIIFLAIIIFLGWFFSDILIYMFAAFVLSFLGTPLVKLLTHIKIGKFQFPVSLAAAITLIAIILVIFLAFYFLIPVISKEITSLMAIDPTVITSGMQDWFNKFDQPLRKFGIIGRHEHFSAIISNEWQGIIQKVDMSNIVSNTLSATGTILVALFSILFMTFFSLKDHSIFFKMIKGWIPLKYRDNFDHILEATRKQVSSYFIGVLIEMLTVGALDMILCLMFRVPNAVLIGSIGGLLNIIPYVGPLIACLASIVITVTSLIPLTPEAHLITAMVIKVVIAFGITKLVDDFVLQPYIYGKSTQTHPLEIFIVILMAGYIGGVFGMIFAVPAYTLIRIVVKEFFGAYYFIEATDNGETIVPTPPKEEEKKE